MQTDKKRFVMSVKQLNESLAKVDQAAKKHPNVLFRYAIHFPYCVVDNKELLKYFGSTKDVADASLSDLQKIAGISKKTAEKIYNYFHN